MKKILALLLTAVLLFGGYKKDVLSRFKSFEPQAKSASAGIFTLDGRGNHEFFCSGVKIGATTNGGGLVLTARHCVADIDTNKINKRLSVSFSGNQGGPFYDAVPVAISLTDDLALLYIRNGADVPFVLIKDERRLHSGDPIFNVGYPLGMGKSTFHGEFMESRFLAPSYEFLEGYPVWVNAMPVNMTVAPGSSGSGIFSQREHGLIGIVVGESGKGTFNIAIPADRIIDFMNDLQDNTVEKFRYAFPEHEEDVFRFF